MGHADLIGVRKAEGKTHVHLGRILYHRIQFAAHIAAGLLHPLKNVLQFLIDFHKRPLYFDFPQDLMDEHGVSKGEESVTLFDSHVVGVQDIFPAGQSGN